MVYYRCSLYQSFSNFTIKRYLRHYLYGLRSAESLDLLCIIFIQITAVDTDRCGNLELPADQQNALEIVNPRNSGLGDNERPRRSRQGGDYRAADPRWPIGEEKSFFLPLGQLPGLVADQGNQSTGVFLGYPQPGVDQFSVRRLRKEPMSREDPPC